MFCGAGVDQVAQHVEWHRRTNTLIGGPPWLTPLHPRDAGTPCFLCGECPAAWQKNEFKACDACLLDAPRYLD